MASPDPRLHFSTGEAPRSIESADVLWPGGEREAIDVARLAFGTHVVVEKGRGVVDVRPLEPSP